MQAASSQAPSPKGKEHTASEPRRAGVRVIDSDAKRPLLDWRELWGHREVVFFLAWRSFKARYRQTYLGILWAILQPLIAMGVYTVIFGRLVGVPSDGVPYPLFVLAALVPWNFVSRGITSMTTCLVGNQDLVTRVYFPRIAIPLSTMVTVIVDMLYGCIIIAAGLVLFGIAPPVQALLLPLFLLQIFAITLGVGLMTAAINVRFRDVGYLVPFAMQTMLFLTPVVYPASLLPEAWRVLYALNPMVGVIGGVRWCLLGTPVEAASIMLSVVGAIAVLWGGLRLFARSEDVFADHI